jgi:hypothetical protein
VEKFSALLYYIHNNKCYIIILTAQIKLKTISTQKKGYKKYEKAAGSLKRKFEEVLQGGLSNEDPSSSKVQHRDNSE